MTGELSPVWAYQKQASMLDYRGHLAMVLFLSGCNFRCGYCHNRELIEVRPGMAWTELEDVCRGFRSNWADAAVISGGEPTLSPLLPELVGFLKNLQFKVKLDTNGSRPDVLQYLLPLLDYVAVDVKCCAERYKEFTGFDGVTALERSIEILKHGSTSYELRTTIVQDFHTPEEIERMRPLIRGAKLYVLQPFVPRENLTPPYRDMPRTQHYVLEDLCRMVEGEAEKVIC